MSSAQTPVPIATLLAHREWVRRLARSLVQDEASADDVEQRTWLTALRSPPRNAASVRAWLARVVRNQALDSFRASGRREVHERTAARGESVRSTADVVAEAESQKRVVVAVWGLAEPYRTTMLLRYFEDLPPRAVAARMGVPVETVRTRLRRAAESVRTELGGSDGTAWLGALTPLLVVPPDGGAALWTAGGIGMKVSTKIVVSTLALGAVSALTLIVVETTRSGAGEASATATLSHPDVPPPRADDRTGARDSRTPRVRDAYPAGVDTVGVRSPGPTPPRPSVPAAVASVDAAHAARAVTVTSAPRRPERAAPVVFPSSADELLDLLAQPATPPIPQNELSDDAAAFARGFVRRRDAATVDPLTMDPAAALADGARILFPAGCHRWDTTALSQGRPFPHDLLVEGAGMDSTLVVPTQWLVAPGKVRGITFRNLTIHCNDSGLLSVGNCIVHLDHVRVIGFDSSSPLGSGEATDPGAGEIISGQSVAVLAEDCRFEAGFGSRPGRMRWFLGTSPATTPQSGWLTIARFERCVFLGPFTKPRFSVFLTSPPGATVYSRCDLIDVTPVDRVLIDHPEKTPEYWTATYLRFEDCRVSYADASDGTPRPRRDVSELNPAWTMPPAPAAK